MTGKFDFDCLSSLTRSTEFDCGCRDIVHVTSWDCVICVKEPLTRPKNQFS